MILSDGPFIALGALGKSHLLIPTIAMAICIAWVLRCAPSPSAKDSSAAER